MIGRPPDRDLVQYVRRMASSGSMGILWLVVRLASRLFVVGWPLFDLDMVGLGWYSQVEILLLTSGRKKLTLADKSRQRQQRRQKAGGVSGACIVAI